MNAQNMWEQAVVVQSGILYKPFIYVIAVEQLEVTEDVLTQEEKFQLPLCMGYAILMCSPGVRASLETEMSCETIETQLCQAAKLMTVFSQVYTSNIQLCANVTVMNKACIQSSHQ